MKISREHSALIFALLAVLLWSTVASAFKIALKTLSAVDLLCLSVMVSTLALGLAHLIHRRKPSDSPKLPRRTLLTAMALGFLNPLLYYAVLFHAYDRLPAQIAQPLNYSWPLFLALLAAPLLGQKPGRYDIPGIMISIGGVALISHVGSGYSGSVDAIGIVLALGSGFLWAIYWLIGMRLKMQGSLRLLTGFSTALVPALLIWVIRGAPLPATPGAAVAVLWVGLFEMGITFLFWNAAMERSKNSARIGNLVYLGPFISLFWIALILRESIYPQTIAGLTLIVLGILVGQGLFSKSQRPLTLSVIRNIHDIAAKDWNRLALLPCYSPFLEYEFLSTLERSGAASAESGWYPFHFVLRDKKRLVAIAPAYIKTHSMGEFIFDQGLAEAAVSMRKKYYPKLVATLPFTPIPGYRIMVDPKYDERILTDIILDGMKSYRDEASLGSHSFLFTDPLWSIGRLQSCNGAGGEEFQAWAHHYFLWENRGYRDFSDYLNRFNKNQRRNIRRERASMQNLVFRHFSGDDLSDSLLNAMYGFYRKTNEQFGPWAAFFLNREWFVLAGREWSGRIIIFTASHADSPDDYVGMSMLVRKNDQLFGRYWGSCGYVPNLHFELCYYAPIEYAITEGIRCFDPGMGSYHKARRGFSSREFISYHCFADPLITELFGSVLDEANRGQREAIDDLDASIPWRSS